LFAERAGAGEVLQLQLELLAEQVGMEPNPAEVAAVAELLILPVQVELEEMEPMVFAELYFINKEKINELRL
jgi:hypothetical protein